VLADKPFTPEVFSEVDQILASGACPNGRLELETDGTRLSCLIHKSAPHVAGVLEQDQFSGVPLVEFPLRAREMEDAVCRLVQSDSVLVLLIAVHYRNRPTLQASTKLVDPDHVLDVLAEEGQDAALALERSNSRTLLFLQKGKPTRIYFGRPEEDPQEGDIGERFLLSAFAPKAEPGKIEVFQKLNIDPDPDAGTMLVDLFEAAKPPPPINIIVSVAGREVLQRPFMLPNMTIGRDRTCELVLDNLSVSRKHARLLWERGRFVIEDLGSANGVFVNGKPVKRYTLGPSIRVGIGKFELALAASTEATDPNSTIFMERAAHPQAFLTGDQLSAPLALSREITIGKAPGVDAMARGFGVLPVHARIRPQSAGLGQLSCFGRAVVEVNDKKTQQAMIRIGDKIKVGKSTFWLVPKV